MKMDTNTNGHRQWFYFSVKNILKTTIKFNIFRFRKRYSLFQRGMKPYVRSRKGKNFWHPGGSKIYYKKQKYSNQYGVHKDKNTYYLTFQYKFQFQQDQVFFAAGIPYTYSFLNKQIKLYTTLKQDKSIRFTKQNICKSMCGLNIPLITIQPVSIKQNQEKNYIIINARTHAGQTSCSWVLDGLLSQIAQSQYIQKWINQNNIVFKIIPMLNPDGVFMGNYRTGIIGDDFNRKFLSGKKQFFPQIYGLKKIISQCKKKGNIQLFLDLHGHSILKNSFIYGPIDQLFCQFPLKALPYSLWHSSKYFRFSSCKFRFQKQLIETARVYFQIKQSILTFTCENSLGLYFDQNQTFQMLEKDYKNFGVSIIQNICELLTKQKIILKLQDLRIKQKQKIKIESQLPRKTNINQSDQKKVVKIKNTFSQTSKNTFNQTNKNGVSPKKKFPSIQNKINQKEINQPTQIEDKKKLQKQKQYRDNDLNIRSSERKQIKKKNIKIDNLLTAKSDKAQKKQTIEVDKRIQDMLNQDLITKQFLQTGGIFPKRIQQFQSKKRQQKDIKFKIRRKSDALKFMPENLKKKIGQKPIKNISSSKYINENQQNCPLQRSLTYDSAYLSTHGDKLETQNKNFQVEMSEQSDNSLQIIDQKFSQGYESMNDEDSQSQDLCQKQKNFILQYIRNNRKLKTTQNQDSQEQLEIDQLIKQNPQNLITNINGFKEIRFKSIEQKIQKGIPSLKQAKREPHKFRQFTHKSLGRDCREEDGLIQIIQRKKLNQRVQTKKNRDPYLLIQIKNKNH